MFCHVLCGLELRSEVRFPSLPVAEPSSSSAASVTLLASREPLGEPLRWLYNERHPDTEELSRAVGVTERGYLVRLAGVADVLLEAGAATALVHAAPGARPEVLEALFLEQIVPLWWSSLGRPCLHASAVACRLGAGARAVAFAGSSGRGKSTLAASLVAARDPAAALLADDCLALDVGPDRVLAHPGAPSVRLLGDAAEHLFASSTAGEHAARGGKRRLALDPATSPLPLARIYVLEPTDSAPAVTPLRPRDAVARLAACLFRIDPEDRSRLAAELDLLEQIAARAPVMELRAPRSFAALEQVRATIAADLAHP